jgi:uncharacterized protein
MGDFAVSASAESAALAALAPAPPALRLTCVAGLYAICRLPAGAPVPAWALGGSLVSVTHTPDELSIVCQQASVPPDIRMEPGWRCFQVPGPLDFALTGILARLTGPLAAAGVPAFALSTFDTDYLLVREADAARALAAWITAGIDVQV